MAYRRPSAWPALGGFDRVEKLCMHAKTLPVRRYLRYLLMSDIDIAQRSDTRDRAWGGVMLSETCWIRGLTTTADFLIKNSYML